MDVSFIIPALNEEKIIESCLESIKSQKTKLKFEVIVVDGGSKDRTVKIARRYAKVPKKLGKTISSARNLGADMAKGKLLVFVDADTTLPPEYINTVWDRLGRKENVVALTARIIYPSKKRRFIEPLVKAIDFMWRIPSKLGFGRLVGVNLAVWKWAFDRVGGFPETFSEDLALQWRLRKLRKRVEYFDGTYVKSSPRRAEDNILGIMPFYWVRDFLTWVHVSRLPEGWKKFLMEKLGRKVYLAPIR